MIRDRRRVIVTLRLEGRVEGCSAEEVLLLVRHYERVQAMYPTGLDRLRNGHTAQYSA